MALKTSRGRRWIEGTEPESPVSEGARRALSQRLGAVLYYLPRAAKESDKDVEYVHQLRVASRRSVAALQIFKDLIPRQQAKRTRKLLRRVRRTAGDARDLDVLKDRLKKRSTREVGKPRAVIRRLARLRQEAQRPLVRLVGQLRKAKFKKELKSLVKSVRWKADHDEPSFGDFARAALQPCVDDFFAKASGDLSTADSLHELRISGKHLRYAMELLVGAFDRRFREELYLFFEEVQSKLGEINDHATARRLYEGWLHSADEDRTRKELGELLSEEALQIELASDQFRTWWTTNRAATLRDQFACQLSERAEVMDCRCAGDRQDGFETRADSGEPQALDA